MTIDLQMCGPMFPRVLGELYSKPSRSDVERAMIINPYSEFADWVDENYPEIIDEYNKYLEKVNPNIKSR